MQKLSALHIILLVFSSYINAQNSDCVTSIPLCQDFYTQDQAPISTGDIYEFTGVCNLNAEWGSVWYSFTVQQDGLLSFIINPNDPNADYDWALFDISAGGCAGIIDGGTSPEVSCNSWGTLTPPNGPTGISTANGGIGNTNGPGDLNGPPFNADLPVTAGQTFALVVMNWSSSTQGYTIDFGESTASLYDELPPSIISVESNCTNTELIITFSEPILVSSVHINDFTIIGPGGNFSVTAFEAATGGTATLDNSFVLTLDQQIAAGGAYEITITFENGQVKDICGNLGAGTFTFPVAAPLTFNVETETACNGQGGTIEVVTITGGVEPYIFSLDGDVQIDYITEDLTDGTYVVLIEDAQDCAFQVDAMIPNNLISISPAPDDTISCLHPTAILDGALVIPGQPVTWQWSTTDGHFVSGSNTISPTVDAAGFYTLTVINTENGCTATAFTEVISDEEVTFDPAQLRIPNIVTANNDSKNDKWKPFLANAPDFNVIDLFSQYSLKIFNRWGNLVFESKKDGWDASDFSEGSYFFVMQFTTECGDGASADLEGYVMVVKGK
ncbi:MAG: gliding motility-associated C-terminal domain-containing protein [Flavobacteriales bacterium]|nr:gliding motility-associated C-terminal domain-containing protein [Flavobacteriales bacterium]